MAPHSAIDIEAVTDTEAISIPEALTVKGVSARRAKSGKLVAGIAAHTTSDFFKSPVSTELKIQGFGLLYRHLESQKPNDGIVSHDQIPLLSNY